MNRTAPVLAAVALAAAIAAPLAVAQDYDHYDGVSTDLASVGYQENPDDDFGCSGTLLTYVAYAGGEYGTSVDDQDDNQVASASGDRYYVCMSDDSTESGLWMEDNTLDDLQTETVPAPPGGDSVAPDKRCATLPGAGDNVVVDQYATSTAEAAIGCPPAPTADAAPLP